MKSASIMALVALSGLSQDAFGARDLSAARLPAPCAVPDTYYPFRTCKISKNDAECGKGFNAFATMEQCCSVAFGKEGCNGPSVEDSCWMPGEYYPLRTCNLISNASACALEWGNWPTWKDCCTKGSGAFEQGCTEPEPCFHATDYHPERKCGVTKDQSICLRGWGTFADEESCCEKGAAFSQGCGPVE